MTQEKPLPTKALAAAVQAVTSLILTIPEQASDDPIRTAHYVQSALADLKTSIDVFTLIYCRFAYVAAETLSQNRDQWVSFTDDPYWEKHKGHKPKSEIHEECLKWMMIFVFRAEDDNAKDRARIYAGALQVAFDAKQDANGLIEYVKAEGGIDDLYRKNLKIKKKKKQENSQGAVGTGKVLKLSNNAPEVRGDHRSGDGKQLTPEGAAGVGSYRSPRAPNPRGPMSHDELLRQIQAINARGLVPLLVAAEQSHMGILSRLSSQEEAARLNVRLMRQTSDWFEVDCVGVEGDAP